uniref:Uncharacterized protein n=1 Tax=Cacopsylla melanoneura TaxID=428564 RepID=A0A8D8XME4_9HEMI
MKISDGNKYFSKHILTQYQAQGYYTIWYTFSKTEIFIYFLTVYPGKYFLLRYRDSTMNWRRHENRRMSWLERTRNLLMTFTMPATPLLNSPVVSTNWELNCADSRGLLSSS